MDVRLPDGTVIKNIPDGTTKDQLIQKLQTNGYDVSKLTSSATEPPSEIPAPRTGVPEWGQRNPTLYGIAGAARETLGPLMQAGAGIAGGLVGAPAGLAGAVGGSALGYGMGTQALRAIDRALGNVDGGTVGQEAMGALGDVATGAAMEMGGRLAGQAVGAVAPSIVKGAHTVAKTITAPKQFAKEITRGRAAEIARQSAGAELPDVLSALRSAPSNLTAAQSASPVYSPTTQSLLERAGTRIPNALTGTGAPGVTEAQTVAANQLLAQMAGGETQTATRSAATAAKKELNAALGSTRNQALARANAGQFVAQLEEQAGTLNKEAAEQVQRVRELVNAGKVAEASTRGSVRQKLIEKNLPVGLNRYTYEADLSRMSDKWASQAANASLDLGQGARFAQTAADRLRQLGISPLKTDKLISEIAPILKNSNYAGDDALAASIRNVMDDIQKWTSSGGVIDANALYAIRKNSVAAGVAQARPGIDATSQRNLEAKVLSEIKPLIDDAIERAGGRGFKQYLADYSVGMQEIAKQKLSAEAMKLYKNSPEQFVKLVQGESPEVVEKFLGKGNYNLGQELSQDALTKLRGVADVTQRGIRAAEQATKGQEAYRDILTKNIPRLKLPWGLSPSGAAINKGLDVLERKLGDRVMQEIAEASKTAKSYEELLQFMPKSSADKLRKVIASDAQLMPRLGAGTVQTINALSSNENRNALAD